MTKNILIVHGYLLQDSGSCVYVRNLAQGFQKQGYHVTIACQDVGAASLDGISLVTESVEYEETSGITVFLPISPFNNHLLPVYIYNPYQGYTAKVTTEMSLQEGFDHVKLVSQRLADLLNAHKFDFIFTNHCLFSPVNVKRALDIHGQRIPYVCKIHGSALNFVAAKDERWHDLIYEGLKGAKKIICGTKYMKDRLYEVLDKDALPPVDTVACGVNTSLFSAYERTPLSSRVFRVVYFSHILNTKGIAELLLAMTMVKARVKDIEFHIMGTGTYVSAFQAMIKALQEGDESSFTENAHKDNFLEEHIEIGKYFSQSNTEFITYHGFVTHQVLAPFLASCDVMVAPSKASEAFGMVTIESMAAGVYPVVADHSGLSNVVDLIGGIDRQLTESMRITFPDGKICIDEMVSAISEAISFVKKHDAIDERLKNVSLSFDWKQVCEKIMN